MAGRPARRAAIFQAQLGELEDLLNEIDNCTSQPALKKLGVRLTLELQEARDIAFMALETIQQILETVSEFPDEMSVEINQMNANLKEEMKQRWNMTNEEIGKIEGEEPGEQWGGGERVH